MNPTPTTTPPNLPPQRTQDSRPRKKGPSRFGRVIIVTVVALLAVLCGYAAYIYHYSRVARSLPGILWNHPDVQHQFPGVQTMNLMIVGRDYDYNNEDVVIKTHARSDLLMIAKLDLVGNTIKILSIPRDTRAYIPGHGVSKINAAHAFGGPQLSMQTIMLNYNIPSDHYIALDFSGFEKAINLLGGVDITVDKKMDYDDNWGHLHIHLLPGYQHLNGSKAIGFVRFRHSDSDLIRTKRQQALLAELRTKVEEPHTLVILPQLLDTINDNVNTDLTDSQKLALAFFIKGVPKSNIEMETLPSDEGGYYVRTDWAKADPLIRKWFGVDPPLQPGEHRSNHLRRVASQDL